MDWMLLAFADPNENLSIDDARNLQADMNRFGFSLVSIMANAGP